MAGVLQGSRDGQGSIEPTSKVANSFIATVYFKQATSLLDRGLYADAEAYFREVLRIWPDHAGAWNNLGTAVWRQKRLQEAETYHRRARKLKPDDFAILNNLGNVLWEQRRLSEAVRFYRRAIKLKPDSAEALVNLGVTLSDLGQFDESHSCIRESIRLQPAPADSHVNLGMNSARQGNLDEALLCYEEALRRRPDFPEARRNRSYIWLIRGDFERGWPEYEWRLKCPTLRLVPVQSPRWTGEDLDGRTILLVAEQGLGDTLHFIRYAPLVKRRGGRVLVACPEPLMRLVARCPGIDHVADWLSPLPDSDCHVYLMSLPAILRTTLATIPAEVPYSSVDDRTLEAWQPVVARVLAARSDGIANGGPGRDFKIGIVWQGNPDNTNDRWRSFSLTYVAHLAALPGVRLISLQKGAGTEQLAKLAGRFSVAELGQGDKNGDDRRDFLDTAAVMSQLDLVIAPETSVAHLAGSLGVRVWVALPFAADWRWLLDRDDSPWYPTMRLFRQTKPGNWEGVFTRMAEALRAELAR
jgi:Flp pilus assembly protein TadD